MSRSPPPKSRPTRTSCIRLRTSGARREATIPKAPERNKGRRAPIGSVCQSIAIPKEVAKAKMPEARRLTRGLTRIAVIIAQVLTTTKATSIPIGRRRKRTSNNPGTQRRVKSTKRRSSAERGRGRVSEGRTRVGGKNNDSTRLQVGRRPIHGVL